MSNVPPSVNYSSSTDYLWGEEDSADAVAREFRSVIQNLRTELDNAFKNVENRLETIDEQALREQGVSPDNL